MTLQRVTKRSIFVGSEALLGALCRAGEWSMARWDHVDSDARTWLIPKANVKGNANDFTVYLSDFALDQFRQLHALTGPSAWCFPAKNRAGHVCVRSLSKQIGDRQTRFKKSRDGSPRRPMQHRQHDTTLVLSNGQNGAWTPHDLGRTGAPMVQSLGVPLETIDRCQNHVLAGSKVRQHYLYYDYAGEKRDAWQRWGNRLSLMPAAR